MADSKEFLENQELQRMDLKALVKEMVDLESKLFKISFEVKSGQSKRSDLVNKYKKQIARVKTAIQGQDQVAS